jgi:hypothetical protein
LLVRNEDLDIIGITETWLNENITDSEMLIDGYTLLRKDRNDNRRGGVAALYVKNEITSTYREEIMEQDFPEALFCSINCGNDTLIGVFYRPPNSSAKNDTAMYSLINRVSANSTVIMGDFNFPELDWTNINSLEDTHPFMRCINKNFLSQVVDKPTREKNVLDLILTSDDSIIGNVLVGNPLKRVIIR